MKISKFPLFSLILLGGVTVYAVAFCKFDGARVLFDNRCKAFVQGTMTAFLNDFEKAKGYKAPEISDETLAQLQGRFKTKCGRCEFKDISLLKGFKINLPVVTKTYLVTLNCEKKQDMPLNVIVRQQGDKVQYFGLWGNF